MDETIPLLIAVAGLIISFWEASSTRRQVEQGQGRAFEIEMWADWAKFLRSELEKEKKRADECERARGSPELTRVRIASWEEMTKLVERKRAAKEGGFRALAVPALPISVIVWTILALWFAGRSADFF